MHFSALSTFILCYASIVVAVPVASQSSPNSTSSSTAGANRPNPTYTQEQLNNIKLAYTAADRYKYIASLGDTDTYFKFDYSVGANPNPGPGVGQGGKITVPSHIIDSLKLTTLRPCRPRRSLQCRKLASIARHWRGNERRISVSM